MATVCPQIPPCSSPVTSSQPLPPHTMTVPTYQPFKGAEEDEEDSQSESEGEEDDKDKEEEEEEGANIPEVNSALFIAAPSVEDTRVALKDLGLLLRPPRLGLSEYDYIMSFIIMYCNHMILVTQVPVCIGCILISYCNQLYS